MAFDKEQFDAYFDRGVDLTNRRVFIGDIDAESITSAVKGLYLMETEDSEQPCEMFISSFGGDLYEAIALFDIVQTLRCPVHTFGYGKVMSAAQLLLACGKKGERWVSPHAHFMHHASLSGIEEKKLHDAVADIEHWKLLQNQWFNLMAEHTKRDLRFWRRLASKPDYYFGAQDAIEYGLADEIWVEK